VLSKVIVIPLARIFKISPAFMAEIMFFTVGIGTTGGMGGIG
jgi:hypothetical protein